MQFTLGTNNFKIEYSDIDDAIACSFDNGVGGWTWFLVENSDKVMRKEETVPDFLNRFLTKLNEKLAALFGEVEVPGEFATPLEELNYRIANNIVFDGTTLTLNV